MNPRLRLAAAAACAVTALGCGGLLGPPPGIVSVNVTPDACGAWTATVEATGNGDSLAIEQDGAIVRTFNVQGTQTFTATGTAAPGRTTTITARIAGVDRSTPVAMPAVDATLVLSPPEGTFALNAPAPIDVLLSTPCTITNATMHVKVIDTRFANRLTMWSSDPLPMPGAAGTRVVIPAQTTGLFDVEVSVESGGVPIAHSTAKLYWGNPDDDLDRDGAEGGLNGSDCDDHDPAVSPLLAEAPLPNQKDDNCDGRIDEGTTAYDDDGDGLTEEKGDCDDADPGRHPGAKELPDCRDQNCDGTADEGVTLAKSDDPYEPNDSRAHAIDLQTSRQRSFTHEITSVTRDLNDDEWFKFYSQDGDWDSWGIDALATGIPDGSTYDIELYEDGDYPLQTLHVVAGSHETLLQRGAMFRDDSGDYFLRIHPVKIAQSWCPVSVSLTSY